MPLPFPSRLRLVSRPKLLIGLLATAAVLLALGLFPSDARAADAPTETLELHPGDNFVGWVAEPIAVADIFEQISAATLIYTWNADSRTYRHAIRDVGGTLERLDPGMSARIRIEGRKTVKWERSLTPAKGMVTLYSGVNWVAWNGRDEWPLDQVARGIGTSLVSIEVEERGIVYQPSGNIAEAIEPLSGKSTLRRGDALRVTVNRDLRWLQPTGMMPNIIWVGTFSPELMDDITADIRRVVDFFAEEFAVETDFADTTALLYSSIDAAVEYAGSEATLQFGYTPEVLRVRMTAGWLAQGKDWGFFLSACGWQSPAPQPCYQRTIETLTHEWFHHLQGQLSTKRPLVSPVWMIEGPAIWAEWQLPSLLTNVSYDSELDWRLDATARIVATLESVEQPYTSLAYTLGSVAAERLAAMNDADAHIEYNRQLYPQASGTGRRWLQTPTWHEAFEAAFGLPTAAFYEDFEAWRETLPIPHRRYNYSPEDVELYGTLLHDDGSPASGFRVETTAYLDGADVSFARTAIVDKVGRFSIEVAPQTRQRIVVTRSGCRLWLSDRGLTTAQPQPGEYGELDTNNLSELNLTLPEGACENELRAKVIRLRDEDRAVQVLLIDEETGAWFPTRLGGSGEYIGYAPKPGRYNVLVRLDDCAVHYSEYRIVASGQDADVLNLDDEAVSIEFRIPDDLCVHRISGRIVDQDGNTVGGGWIQMADGHASSSGGVAADGSFGMEVPDSGEYVLFTGTEVEDCYIAYSDSGGTAAWRFATPIVVSDSDVTGIEFVVPSDPSSLCE